MRPCFESITAFNDRVQFLADHGGRIADSDGSAALIERHHRDVLIGAARFAAEYSDYVVTRINGGDRELARNLVAATKHDVVFAYALETTAPAVLDAAQAIAAPPRTNEPAPITVSL